MRCGSRIGAAGISRRVLAAALMTLAVVSSVRAEGPRCVIELFTSQGCSSCPPADRLAAELALDPRNIIVSFPVDYWDYIGWKDTLASPAFTARQKAYASARGDGHVYTPQAVINGLVHAVGSDRSEITAAVAASASRPGVLNVALKMNESAAGLHVDVGAAQSGAPASAGLWLLRTSRQREVAIGRGENAGRSVIYTNVVRSMVKLGDWQGTAASFDVPAGQLKGGDADSYVIILQSGSAAKPGAILAAAKSS